MNYRVKPRFEKLLPKLIPFGGGVAMTRISESAWEHCLSKPDFLYFTVLILIFAAVGTVTYTREKIRRQIKRVRLTAQFFAKTGETDSEFNIYDPLLRHLSRAKRSIQIVSAPINLKSSPARQKYYAGLRDILAEKQRGKRAFIYERILQVTTASPADRLETSQVDKDTYDHCYYVVENVAKAPGVSQFVVKQVSHVTSPFVIIDDNEVLFFMPWIEDSEPLQAAGLGKAVFIRDNEGALVTQMRAMYQVINNHAHLIQHVEGPATP